MKGVLDSHALHCVRCSDGGQQLRAVAQYKGTFLGQPLPACAFFFLPLLMASQGQGRTVKTVQTKSVNKISIPVTGRRGSHLSKQMAVRL
jgi:hypothetical protein